jgi:hypothetical protein
MDQINPIMYGILFVQSNNTANAAAGWAKYVTYITGDWDADECTFWSPNFAPLA